MFQIKFDGLHPLADDKGNVHISYDNPLINVGEDRYASLNPFHMPLVLDRSQVIPLLKPTRTQIIAKLVQHDWRYIHFNRNWILPCRLCGEAIDGEYNRLVSPRNAHYHVECAAKAPRNRQLLKWPRVPDEFVTMAKEMNATHVLGENIWWRFWRVMHHPDIEGIYTIVSRLLALPSLEPTPWRACLDWMPKSALEINGVQPWDKTFEEDDSDAVSYDTNSPYKTYDTVPA